MTNKPLSDMTIREKIALCSGEDFWNTKSMPQYGIPSIMASDGPHGLRKQISSSDMLGLNRAYPATCFPTASLSACSWDEMLLAEMGQTIAREAAAAGVSLLLGPGANIKRNPLCGRNFEYFSEDPYLTGKLAAAYIRGVENTGVMSCLKHFALNSQEYKRFSSNSMADERTMHEIYLSGFETAVREGKPSTVMCAYNKVNGVFCSENKELLTNILREQWQFDGLVVTDWGAINNRLRAFEAGCDLSMPGGTAYLEKEAAAAVETGDLPRSCVDASAERVIRLAKKGQTALCDAPPADMEMHHGLARKVCEESAVLLKNQDSILPLQKNQKIALIGSMARSIRYQGAGSSHINPWRLTQPADFLPDAVYAAGVTEAGDTDPQLLSEAVAAAKAADVPIVFAGLTEKYESEGFDRENMHMPDGHNRLISAVAAANPNTVVVLLSGSAVELPWADEVKAILYMGLPGQAGGEAIARLLMGESCPAGKLAETWPLCYDDCISSTFYAGTNKDAQYREGLYVGYRYYSSAGVPVRYPFGYGLSYSSFDYSQLSVTEDAVSCVVTNTGKYPAKEIVQLYVAPPKGDYYRPIKELKGFRKIMLEPGESKTVRFSLDARCFAVWNNGFVVPGGVYQIMVGPHSENLPLSAAFSVPGCAMQAPSVPEWYHQPKGIPTERDFEALLGRKIEKKPLKKGEFTMENSIMEMKDHSFIMKILYKAVEMVIAKGYGGKKDYSDPTFRMMMASAADSSLSGMKINGGMKNYALEGLLEMANGHPLKGLRKMLTPLR